MVVVAHIGNIPVEEWVPFVAPILALYLYGRRKERRRRAAVGALPEQGEALDERTVASVEAEWTQGKHEGVTREHLPLLYPPGPDGMSTNELVARTKLDARTVERLLEELADMDYVEIDERESADEPHAWLTIRGYDLVDTTERALLAAHDRSSGETAGTEG